MLTAEEKKQIKTFITEALDTQPALIEEIITEVIHEKAAAKERELRIREIVQRDFDRFRSTFDALA